MFNLEKSVIKNISSDKPIILLYALPKVGKTTFASKFPNHLIINLDGSSERVYCTRTPKIKSLKEFNEVLSSILKEDHNYRTIVIDTINWLEKLIEDDILSGTNYATLEVYQGGYGKGSALLTRKFQEILNVLEEIRIKRKVAIVLLAHACVKTISTPDSESFDYFSPKLNGKKDKATPSCLDTVLEICDIIAFAHNKILIKEAKAIGVKATKLFMSSDNPAYVAGNRFNMASEIDFSYTAFVNELKKAITRIHDYNKPGELDNE